MLRKIKAFSNLNKKLIKSSFLVKFQALKTNLSTRVF